MCKIHPGRIEEVSQPGVCHRSHSIVWPAWNKMENLCQDREKRVYFLPSLPVTDSEWQWLSCLQGAVFKSSVSTSFHWFLQLISLLCGMSGPCASQQCWKKQPSVAFQHLHWLCFALMQGRCFLGLHWQALNFLFTGSTCLQNRLSALLLCFDSV